METPVSSDTDLLIIGAGPAGLMAAAWASKYGINARIVDDKPDRVQTGHADSLTCRTMELLESFGLSDTLVGEACLDFEMRDWAPDPSGDGIKRVATILTQKAGVSRFQQCLTNQGRIEELFREVIEGQGNIRIERNVKTLAMQIDEKLANLHDRDVYPVTVQVRHDSEPYSTESSDVRMTNGSAKPAPPSNPSDPGDSHLETIRAKYVMGCDGAHSWTRRQVGLELKGDTNNAIWGVMDIVPLTDFPDICQTCVVSSEHHGGMHVVPREGRLVRLYIQLGEVHSTKERFDRSTVTPAILLATAQKIIAPYKLDFKICDWWSVYQVGQRVADKFSVQDRVFLAGDAIHTHSPKVGQGMNVSIQDTYNLTWKLCSVILGRAQPAILKTYETERRSVALALLDVDRATNAYYSQNGQKSSSAPREDLQTFRNKMYSFLSGVAVTYEPSVLIHTSSRPAKEEVAPASTWQAHSQASDSASPTHAPQAEGLARNIVVGQRMPSPLVLNHSNARPTPLAALLPSTGSWRVLVFAGDLRHPTQSKKVQELGDRLTGAETCVGRAVQAGLVEVYCVLAGSRDHVPLLSLPEVFHPWDDRLGWDYGKVFADEKVVNGDQGGDTYEKLGIDGEEGCVVVCRPDQHVGLVCEINNRRLLEDYFSGFLVA